MEGQNRNLITSGIEPVDELLGGLERGELYLVHGEASGKSLFGIQFLIEGLKKGENGALVIRYSPEEAVRRFARLGYDCLEDVYSGRLVILEYSDDIIQKIGKLRELTPVLRELEWLLGETRPERLVFDPVTSVLSGTEGSIDARAKEFSEWARSFGATVVLTVNDSDPEVVRSFESQAAESFRFDLRELGDRAGRFISFEKSVTIPDQAIELDPSRGLFLRGRPSDAVLPHPPSMAELELIREELRSAREGGGTKNAEPLTEIDLSGELTSAASGIERVPDTGELVPDVELGTRRLTPLEELESHSRIVTRPPSSGQVDELDLLFEEPAARPSTARDAAGPLDELSDLLDDLTGTATPLDLELPELGSDALSSAKSEPLERPVTTQPKESILPAHSESSSRAEQRDARGANSRETRTPGPPRHARASDLKMDSAIAARAAEFLLRPPEAGAESLPHSGILEQSREHLDAEKPPSDGEVRTKDFSILIVEDDAETCDLVTQTLADYTLEIVHDGVSALAKLISFKPDLVILDFDLPVIDGFKVLTLIRASLNVPIIILSGSRMRAIDRVMASELGADYYLTKPFSAKELKHKARQLIARYRGISSWIINASDSSTGHAVSQQPEPAPVREPARGTFTQYKEFAEDVERRVKATMTGGAPFSIVGCRLPRMTANGGRMALRLFGIVQGLVREADLISTNSRNDLVLLLAEAGNSGARAFAGRLKERVQEELNQELSVWMRSFPELEESTEAATPAIAPSQEGLLHRRASDRLIDTAKRESSNSYEKSETKPDPRESYIDFLEHL